ncbi:hypothetical protein JCM10450v2_004816 [Rhodotorula kratochvilovae]
MPTAEEQQHINELQRELNDVEREQQQIMKKDSDGRKDMTINDVLHEIHLAKVKLGDEYLEAALRKDTATMHEIIQDFLKLDKKERELKEKYGLDKLQRRERQLIEELVAAHGPEAALRVVEKDGAEISSLWKGDPAHPELIAAMQLIMRESARAEKAAAQSSRAYRDKSRPTAERGRSKGEMRFRRAISQLYGLSHTGERYYEVREHMQPYAYYLTHHHRGVLATSSVPYARRMVGVRDSATTALPDIGEGDEDWELVEHSIGRLSHRQSARYFAGRRMYARW